EPHHFGTDLEYNQPRLTRNQYLKLAADTGGKRLCGDRSTWYLYSERAAAEIHAHNPDARIIAMLRNPADMIRSLHRHQVQRGRRDDLESLEDALAAEPERRKGRRIPPNARFPESLFYSAIPRYSSQLQRFFETFGRDRVRVILFDDLERDPAGTYRETLGFLGVDPSFAPDFAIHNVAAPSPDSLLYRAWKATTLRYRIRGLAPQRLYTWIRERRRKRVAAASPGSRPEFPPALRRELNARFAAEIDRLEELLDRDLGAWRAAAPQTGD
ncbi:MAG: sulfotransferase domain-containing protein, partial [Candidatus Wenzhouxiangella sp. M2_3B_020]